MNTIKFTAVVYSDKGKIRSNNEDNFYFNGTHLNAENRDERNYFSQNPEGTDFIYGVFDGMGGEALGEEASFIAAATLKKYHNKVNKHQLVNDDNMMLQAIDEANLKICDKMLETGERRIGTTFSAITIKNDRATVYSVGDSRVYLFRNKKLKQISVDDTTVQRLVNMGMLTAEQAKHHEDRHKLTQHLGIYKDEMVVEPHISNEIEIKKGDLFLLCSDGLTDMVEDERIAEIINKSKTCKVIAHNLVEEALKNGGRDNVTVLMLSADSASTVKPVGKSKKNVVLACIIAALAIVLGVFALKGFDDKKPEKIEENNVVAVTALKWANPMEQVIVGNTGSLMIQREPADAEGEIIFTSSDDKIISVTDKGLYTVNAPGEVEITAQLGDVKCVMKIAAVESEENSVDSESGAE